MSVLIAINQIQKNLRKFYKSKDFWTYKSPWTYKSLWTCYPSRLEPCATSSPSTKKLRPRNSRGRKGIVCCAGVWSRPVVVTAIKHQTDWKNNKQNKDVTTSKSGQEKLGKI